MKHDTASSGGRWQHQQRHYNPSASCCDPEAPCLHQGDPRSSCGVCTSQCDCTFWLASLLLIANAVAFGVVIGLSDTDNIFQVFPLASDISHPSSSADGRSTEQLQHELLSRGAFTGGRFERIRQVNSSWLMVARPGCTAPRNLLGSYGTMCQEDALTATVFVSQISHWVNFRNTIYFLSMMGSLLVPLYAYAVHRARLGNEHRGQPPITFYGTPFYHLLRACWFVVGLVVFFWICTEMYQFWWFIGLFQDHASPGPFLDFWKNFKTKMIATVAVGGSFLCWPLVVMVFEGLFFLLGVLPWYAIRAICMPQLGVYSVPLDVELEDIPFWYRVDLFFTQCRQCERLGASMKTWEWLTGTRDSFVDCCCVDTATNAAPWTANYRHQPSPMPGLFQAPVYQGMGVESVPGNRFRDASAIDVALQKRRSPSPSSSSAGDSSTDGNGGDTSPSPTSVSSRSGALSTPTSSTARPQRSSSVTKPPPVPPPGGAAHYFPDSNPLDIPKSKKPGKQGNVSASTEGTDEVLGEGAQRTLDSGTRSMDFQSEEEGKRKKRRKTKNDKS